MGQPNSGNAELPYSEFITIVAGTGETETSHYPKEKKSTESPKVAASEMGWAKTYLNPNLLGYSY